MKMKALIILVIMGLCYDIALILSLEKIYPEQSEITFSGEILENKNENTYIVKVLENKKRSERNSLPYTSRIFHKEYVLLQ